MSAWHRYVFQEDDTSIPAPQKSSETGFASSSSVAGADADVAADGVDPRRRRVGPPVARRASTGSLRPVPGALYAGPPGGHLRHAAGPAPGGHLAADDAAVGDPGRGTESLQDAPRASPNCSTRARRSLPYIRVAAAAWPRCIREISASPAAASPRLVSADCSRPRPRPRLVSADYSRPRSRRRHDSSEKYPRPRGRGVAATRLHGLSTWQPRAFAATSSPRTCPRPRPREKYPARRSCARAGRLLRRPRT